MNVSYRLNYSVTPTFFFYFLFLWALHFLDKFWITNILALSIHEETFIVEISKTYTVNIEVKAQRFKQRNNLRFMFLPTNCLFKKRHVLLISEKRQQPIISRESGCGIEIYRIWRCSYIQKEFSKRPDH